MPVSLPTEKVLSTLMDEILESPFGKQFTDENAGELAREIYEEYTEDQYFSDETLENISETCYGLAVEKLNN